MINVPTSLNNLKKKVNNSDVDKLKTVPIDLKKLSDAVDNDFVKNKVNNLEKRISYATTLIHIINTIQINKI